MAASIIFSLEGISSFSSIVHLWIINLFSYSYKTYKRHQTTTQFKDFLWPGKKWRNIWIIQTWLWSFWHQIKIYESLPQKKKWMYVMQQYSISLDLKDMHEHFSFNYCYCYCYSLYIYVFLSHIKRKRRKEKGERKIIELAPHK